MGLPTPGWYMEAGIPLAQSLDPITDCYACWSWYLRRRSAISSPLHGSGPGLVLHHICSNGFCPSDGELHGRMLPRECCRSKRHHESVSSGFGASGTLFHRSMDCAYGRPWLGLWHDSFLLHLRVFAFGNPHVERAPVTAGAVRIIWSWRGRYQGRGQGPGQCMIRTCGDT